METKISGFPATTSFPTMTLRVADCPFNRTWYPKIVGRIYTDHYPPYAILEEVK